MLPRNKPRDIRNRYPMVLFCDRAASISSFTGQHLAACASEGMQMPAKVQLGEGVKAQDRGIRRHGPDDTVGRPLS